MASLKETIIHNQTGISVAEDPFTEGNYRILCDFEAERSNQLSAKEGDMVKLEDQMPERGWIWATSSDGKSGFLPAGYVRSKQKTDMAGSSGVSFAETEVGNGHFVPHQEDEDVVAIANNLRYFSAAFSPKDVPKFYDISGLTENPEIFKKAVDIFAERYRNDPHGTGGPTHIVGYDARGFLFTPLALELGLPFVLLRKNGKNPGVVVTSNEYHKEYTETKADTMCIRLGSIKPGDRVVLFDDLIATGGTALSGFELISGLGAEVYEFASLICLPGLNGVEKIRTYEDGKFANVPVCTLVDDATIPETMCADPPAWPIEELGRSVGFHNASELAEQHNLN